MRVTRIPIRGWEATKEELKRYLEWVKDRLTELSDEEIMRNEDLVRYVFNQVGGYAVLVTDETSISQRAGYAHCIQHAVSIS